MEQTSNPIVTCPNCDNTMEVKTGRLGDRYSCTWCHTESALTVTDHANNQWDDRSSQPQLYPISAWENGFEIPEPHGLEAEEIQYHHPSRQALLRKSTFIVTSITAINAKYKLKKAIIQSMIKRDRAHSEIATFVNESRISRDGFEKIAKATSRGDQGNGSASNTASGGTDTPGRQRTQ